MNSEVYISIDIEADGPIPGPYSMLNLGAAAFKYGRTKPIDIFDINLQELPGADQHPETMAWWRKQDPKVWQSIRKNPIDPKVAMQKFANWVKNHRGSPVMVVYPCWDFVFVHWYLINFLGRSPFGISALDIKSLACGILETDFRKTTKRTMPKAWHKGAPRHTHRGVDDAIGQGVLLANIQGRNYDRNEDEDNSTGS